PDQRGQQHELQEGGLGGGLAVAALVPHPHLVRGDVHVLKEGGAAAGEDLAEAVPVIAQGHAGGVGRDGDAGAAALLGAGGDVDPVREQGAGGVVLLAAEPVAVPVGDHGGDEVADRRGAA